MPASRRATTLRGWFSGGLSGFCQAMGGSPHPPNAPQQAEQRERPSLAVGADGAEWRWIALDGAVRRCRGSPNRLCQTSRYWPSVESAAPKRATVFPPEAPSARQQPLQTHLYPSLHPPRRLLFSPPPQPTWCLQILSHSPSPISPSGQGGVQPSKFNATEKKQKNPHTYLRRFVHAKTWSPTSLLAWETHPAHPTSLASLALWHASYSSLSLRLSLSPHTLQQNHHLHPSYIYPSRLALMPCLLLDALFPLPLSVTTDNFLFLPLCLLHMLRLC